uniref:Serine/threonine protein phosphatase n=1 Tax=Fundidesulfovibrio putealis TaxID=270496 RepID=A0A7C4AGN7_9BACT
MSTPTPYWIVIGDVHGHTAPLERIPELAGASGVIISGDLTVHGAVPAAQGVIRAVTARNPRVLAQIGNMDQPAVQAWLDREGMGIHTRALELAPGLGLMGVGWSTPTPFGTPSETSEEQIARWLDDTHRQAAGFEHLILVSHTPPVDTVVDRTGSGMHVGSRAVRRFIERVQPDLCLTGHIHEARGADTLGRTLVVNPGELAAGGYAVVTFDGTTVGCDIRQISGGAA